MSVLVTIFAAWFAFELLLFVGRLFFRLIGWTIKASFWLIGLLFSPIWIVLVLVLGLASAGWALLPLVLVVAFVSGILSED